MKHSKRNFIMCLAFTLGQLATAQNYFDAGQNNLRPPIVFLLGEHEQQYEHISSKYITLLEACNNDMESAYYKLHSMMLELEAFASLTGFNLKDVKCWMHFFWNNDGRIDHIGFHLKPASRNIDIQSFKSFLSSFAMQYKFPLNSEYKYAHYSTFSFPVVQMKSSLPTKELVRKEAGG